MQLPTAKPFLRWAGGKRALAKDISSHFPKDFGTYYEPFLGSAALLFAQSALNRAVVNDLNKELIDTYLTVRDEPEALIEALLGMEISKEFFVDIRSWDRDPLFPNLSRVKRGARFLYLNHCAFNGIYRVNSLGHFNVPWGEPTRSFETKVEAIRSASRFLQSRNEDGELLVQFRNESFRDALRDVKPGDLIYLDPPYDVEHGHNGFDAYQMGGFGDQGQKEVFEIACQLRDIGAHVFISNSGTNRVRDLYSAAGFSVDNKKVRRSVSGKGHGRGILNEVLIRSV